MANPAASYYGCPVGGRITGGRHFIGGNQHVDIGGQSNAVARADRADLSAAPLSSDPDLAAFDVGTFSRVFIWDGSAYSALNAANNGASSGQFGPEFGLAVRWMRETTSGNLYINKDALGSTSIDYWAQGGAAYNAIKANRTSADAWLAARSITVNRAGWLWVQGEYDYTQNQAWYESRLSALIAARITDGLMTTNTKRLLAQMVVGSAQYGAGVAAAKASYASANSSNTIAPDMVPTYANYMRTDDQVHANGRGQVYLGYRAFEYFFSANHISI